MVVDGREVTGPLKIAGMAFQAPTLLRLTFVGAVISEMVASNEGIGYLTISAGSSMRIPLVFAGLIVISAMAMYGLFTVVERRTTG